MHEYLAPGLTMLLLMCHLILSPLSFSQVVVGVNVIEKKMSGGKQRVRNTQPDRTFSKETSQESQDKSLFTFDL